MAQLKQTETEIKNKNAKTDNILNRNKKRQPLTAVRDIIKNKIIKF